MLNIQNNEQITLIIYYEQNPYYNHKCDVNESLEKYIIEYAKSQQLDYSSLYILYGGISLLSDDLKKPISKIIKSQDKKDKIMALLLCQNSEFSVNNLDSITIVLSIESVKAVKLNGTKEETIRDIIRNSSLIKLDLKWCIFKYREKDIDLNQKFDDLVDNYYDQQNKEIVITVNYTIPLIVNMINEKNKKYEIKCLLKDKVRDIIDSYFCKKHLDKYDYYLIYENKIMDNYYYKIFYEIISEDKIQNRFPNEKINNNI